MKSLLLAFMLTMVTQSHAGVGANGGDTVGGQASMIMHNVVSALYMIGRERVKGELGVDVDLLYENLKKTTSTQLKTVSCDWEVGVHQRLACNDPETMKITYSETKWPVKKNYPNADLRAQERLRSVIHENYGVQGLEKSEKFWLTDKTMKYLKNNKFSFQYLAEVKTQEETTILLESVIFEGDEGLPKSEAKEICEKLKIAYEDDYLHLTCLTPVKEIVKKKIRQEEREKEVYEIVGYKSVPLQSGSVFTGSVYQVVPKLKKTKVPYYFDKITYDESKVYGVKLYGIKRIDRGNYFDVKIDSAEDLAMTYDSRKSAQRDCETNLLLYYTDISNSKDYECRVIENDGAYSWQIGNTNRYAK
jgi:uncharacterized protein YsxB (DUF464 family)